VIPATSAIVRRNLAEPVDDVEGIKIATGLGEQASANTGEMQGAYNRVQIGEAFVQPEKPSGQLALIGNAHPSE
jgi:hypothetical protein